MKRYVFGLLFLVLGVTCAYAQRQVLVAKTSGAGLLKEIIGEEIEHIDSLVVEGPINAEDFDAIWECAFYGTLQALNLEKAEVQDGKIPDGALFHREAQEIDPFTFYVTNLCEVILPEGVTEIGKNAFRCSCIERIHLPSTLKKMGTSCFYLCVNLNPCPLTIPEGIEQIPADCFRCCRTLTEVQLPASLKTIDYSAFYGDWHMYCNFPEGLESIGEFAFCEAGGLQSVRLPQGCTNIGMSAFDGCENIAEILLPEGLSYIPDFFLNGALALKEIRIPSCVRSIGANAFAQSGLRAVVVPEGVERIGEQAFAHCDLDSIVLPSTLTYLGGQSLRAYRVGKIYSYAQVPAQCGTLLDEGPFKPNAAPLYVPQGATERYRNAPGWDVLQNIREMEHDVAIRRPTRPVHDAAPRLYNMQGKEVLHAPHKGVYIQDGKKTLIK